MREVQGEGDALNLFGWMKTCLQSYSKLSLGKNSFVKLQFDKLSVIILKRTTFDGSL